MIENKNGIIENTIIGRVRILCRYDPKDCPFLRNEAFEGSIGDEKISGISHKCYDIQGLPDPVHQVPVNCGKKKIIRQ
jgi:hypothetical protein